MGNWKDIRLELARTNEFPAGSVSRGYLIRLPLNDHDAVDQAAFQNRPHRAKVRRYWSTEPDESGHVVDVEGGWVMRCNNKPDRILEFGGHPVRVGQQVSIVELDGTVLPFKIAGIR